MPHSQLAPSTSPNDPYTLQKLLICTWIVELKLNEINGIQAARDNETVNRSCGSQELSTWAC